MEPSRCPFCKPFADDIVARNDLCYARWDRRPVSKGHLLIVPFPARDEFFLPERRRENRNHDAYG